MKTLDWFGLYGEGWQNEIVSEAFSHPAKFSRALIRRIYEHAVERGWLAEGDVVVDSFAGVALGALDAMFRGLHWVGVELEGKFVGLGRQNIDLWNSRYNNGMLPRWGTATLLQGDSRGLIAVLGGARAKACVSSPPYIQSNVGNDDAENELRRLQKKASSGQLKGEHLRLALQGRLSPHEQAAQAGYSTNPRNLGNMREGDYAAVVSSPAYASGCAHTGGDDPKPERVEGGELRFVEYGRSAGQLAAMAEGDVDAVISSPPFASILNDKRCGGGIDESKRKHIRKAGPRGQTNVAQCYGQSPGQLAAMPEGAFEATAVVSSPPYMDYKLGSTPVENPNAEKYRIRKGQPGNDGLKSYGNAPGQLCNTQGDTFWSAARVIVQQCHQVLAPNGVAIWVLKAFVRNKQIVDFPDQWRQMCEACGFETLEWIRAWLVEDRGGQYDFEGELIEKRVERKSFFRRLHEKKYPDLSIDFEVVLVMRKAKAI